MKRLLLALFLIGLPLRAQQPVSVQPNCVISVTFTAAGRSAPLDNRTLACTTWHLVYSSTNFTATSIELDQAPDAGGSPGTWAVWANLPAGTTLPLTSTTGGQATGYRYQPFVSINLNSVTGTGSIRAVALGYRPGFAVVDSSTTSGNNTNVAQFGGVNVNTGTGAGGAGTPRVTVSNDSLLADTTASGNITGTACATGGPPPTGIGCVNISVAGQQGVGFVLSGTWVATVQAQVSPDGGTTWQAVDLYNFSNEQVAISTTANGIFAVADTRGASHVRIIATVFTSGTVVVSLRASQTSQLQNTKYDAVAGSASPKHAAYVCGNDGTNCQPIRVDSSGNISPANGSLTNIDAIANAQLAPTSSAGIQIIAPVFPFVFNGTNWDRPRSAGIGNNVVSTGINAFTPYGQFNTPQANSSAPLANITTAQYAGLQIDASGRLIVTPGATQMVLQPSQVAAVANGTTTRNTFNGLGQFQSCDILVNITAGGTATGTMQIFLEDSADAGTTWDDVISSNTFAYGSAVITQHFFLTGQIATTATQGGAAAVETLAAGTVRNGPWADRIRVREKVTLVSGSPTGATYTINAVCKGL